MDGILHPTHNLTWAKKQDMLISNQKELIYCFQPKVYLDRALASCAKNNSQFVFVLTSKSTLSLNGIINIHINKPYKMQSSRGGLVGL